MQRLGIRRQILLALGIAAAAACPAFAKPIPPLVDRLAITSADPAGIYDLGETVRWTVKAAAPLPATQTRFAYVVKRNNLTVIKSGEIDVSAGPATIEAQVDEPAMLYVELRPAAPPAGDEKTRALGAAVAPDKLQPVAPAPDDFDSFWRQAIAQLQKVPLNPRLKPLACDVPGVEFGEITLDHLDGRRIHGQYAKPAREGKFPALVILQWASPPYPLEPVWVTSRAAAGWLVVNIEPHDVLPHEPAEYYAALPESLKHYEAIGRESPATCYFRQMYLADYRAVDYAAQHPQWDGKTLVVMGTSMGGQQSLCVAGLHDKPTHLIVNVPAGCDLTACLHGRQAGYPFFPCHDAAAMNTARYFDAVNFAPRIKAKSLVALGFVDDICPPAGIWTAYNRIPAPKEIVPLVESPHNHLATPEQQRAYVERSEAWLAALARGEQPQLIHRGHTAGDHRPAARTDENSRLAHEQLLAKATAGRIDVYFIGDSITRRWGCTDPQYAELLANWRENFHGYNAANFAWGGDTTHNILWRLENGELDRVQPKPKAFVVLAGTNNLGGDAAAPGLAEDVTRGIQAIVAACQQRAPDAKVIVTSILPRTDKPSAAPTIRAINANLADWADGRRIRFLDLTSDFVDDEGRVRSELLSDGLHLSLRGYEAWAAQLKPLLRELLGPPAAVDEAPPATGDPSAGRSS